MYIRSDESNNSDYIQIGNMILPTDASDFGYESAEEISRLTRQKLDREAEERALEAKRQADIARGRVNYEKAFGNVDETEPASEQLDDLFEILVPPSGSCDNIGGELVRAMMRVMYRYYNDGDYFYGDYGLETCGGDAAYVADNSTDEIYDAFMDIANQGLENDSYKEALNEICELLLSYLREHVEIFGQDNEDCRNYSSSTLREFEETAPRYDYDIDIPSEIYDHVDAGHIDWRDVFDEIDSWAEYDLGGEVENCYGCDSFVVRDLTRSQFDRWDDEAPRWLEQWVDELNEEYPFDEEEEEEEEYEEGSDEDI